MIASSGIDARRRLARLAAPLVVAALTISACGESSPNDDDSTGGEATTTAPDTTQSSGADEAEAAVRDVEFGPELVAGAAPIDLATQGGGLGNRPTLEWTSVPGADRYSVVVLDADSEPYWGWLGSEVSVVFGGGTADGDGGLTAWLHEAMTWTVVAYGADGSVVGLSARGDLAP